MNPIIRTLSRHQRANRKILATVGRMEDIYREARLRLNDLLVKHVTGRFDPLAGANLVRLIEDIGKSYSLLEEAFRNEMGGAVPYVAQSYYADALHDIGRNIIGRMDEKRIEVMLNDAYSHIAGATGNMSKADVAFIRQTGAEVFRLSSATGMTRKEVSELLMARILSRPAKFTFTDAAGRVWDNEAYVKMLSRTVLMNAGRESFFDACIENGRDVVRVTVSGFPCPACAVWENRLLSITGQTEGLPTVDDATSSGLLHPNCTHSFVAVSEVVAGRQFEDDGRPKSGVNSRGKEEKDDKEAWKKYRQEHKPLPKIKDTLQEFDFENDPNMSEYDAKRDDFHAGLIKSGGSKEAAAELADLYTPEIASRMGPPKVIFESFKGNKGAYAKGNEIHISVDPSSWNGCNSTIRHEFGHYVDTQTRLKSLQLQERFAEAAKKDWAMLKKANRGDLAVFAPAKSGQKKAFDLFDKEYKLLNNDEKLRIMHWFDTVGSISNGNHGGGHSRNYYRSSTPNVEAFANMFSAVKSKWPEFKRDFPSLWGVMEDIIKGAVQ